MTIGMPLCAGCKHFHFDDMSGNKCDAFPDGVPEDIFLSRVDHREPYPGDRGIQFEWIDRGQPDAE